MSKNGILLAMNYVQNMYYPRDPCSPSENGNGTQILCVLEVIGHPNHQLRI